jgi:drug/metabolite transporter (DMT)-like permease
VDASLPKEIPVKLKEWGAFALLGTIWGTSFLWIKIAVQDIGPFTLVAFRILFGLLGLLVVMRWQRQSFPRDRQIILAYLILSVFQTALPFVLISWGETHIDSAVAAILNATVPLFTIVIAHFWLHDEKITLNRLAGLIVGFVGVVILMSRDLGPAGLRGNVLGQLAVLVAAISYAVGVTFTRRNLRGKSPIVQSTMTLLFANAFLWLVTPFAERPLHLPTQPITWLALLWLGLLGSCTAYLLYFYLINTWGATRAAIVTYVFPVIGLILGIVFLDESIDARLIAGSLLVVAGIAIVNVKLRRAIEEAPAPTPAR